MKNKLTAAIFLIIIYGLFISAIVMPDAELSVSERRRLKQMPKLDAGFAENFNSYATDQFPFREKFRAVKAFFDGEILKKSDTNGYFTRDGHIYKTEYPLNPEKVENMCRKIINIRDLYLSGLEVSFSIVPDKNYFLEEGSALLMDYAELERIMLNGLPDMEYINLFNVLGTDDYYKTDSHWRQECLAPVLEALGVPFDIENYTQGVHYPFYGVYYGQLARSLAPDTLVWLENDINKSAYDVAKLGDLDPYELFLGGVSPIITLNGSPEGKGLIIFGDSYATALAPLLLEKYSSVTLVDMRLVKSAVLGEHIDFSDQDILFLYSTTVINNSDMVNN